MLSIYKTPPEVCFSGNPIIIGVKDSDQLTTTYEQKCIVVTSASMLSGLSYITIVYSTFSKTYTFGTDIPSKGSLTDADWIASIFDVLNSDYDLCSLLQINIDNIYLIFIEREAIGNIMIKTANEFPHTRVSDSILMTIPDHYIIIKPEKLYSINFYTITPNPITEIYKFFGYGIELESLPYIISEDSLIKNGDGSVYADYDLSKILQEDKTTHFDTLSVYKIYDLVSTFRLFIAAKRDNVITENAFSEKIRVIDAKISEVMQAKINEMDTDLWTYIINNKRPLTWQPDNKIIDIYWPELLYFPVNTSGTYHYHVREYFTNGGTATHEVQEFVAYKYQIVMLSAAFLNVRSDSGFVVSKFEVWVEDDDENVVMEANTYYMDYTYQKFARWWVAKNSFGVYECFRTTGLTEKGIDTEKTFINVDLPDYYVQTDRKRKQSSCKKSFNLTVNSGPLNYSDSKQFTELLESKDVYLLVEGNAIPVEIEEGSFTIKTDADNLTNYKFEVTASNIDDSEVDISVQLPVMGDFNFDFNESYYV